MKEPAALYNYWDVPLQSTSFTFHSPNTSLAAPYINGYAIRPLSSLCRDISDNDGSLEKAALKNMVPENYP
jgi:hypothetical protein